MLKIRINDMSYLKYVKDNLFLNQKYKERKRRLPDDKMMFHLDDFKFLCQFIISSVLSE